MPRDIIAPGANCMTKHVLAIDQGTTSTRAIVFRADCTIAAIAQLEFPQHYPAPGWVEHDPEDLWRSVLATCRAAIAEAGLEARDIAAVGIANQRETVLVWDRVTGRPIHNAIVWQDRRTAEICRKLKDAGGETLVARCSGLLLDPYFSASKIAWLLDNVAGARAKAERGALAFGTVDSFLLWRLTGGAVHATDATNASRTALYDIHANAWSAELCALFGVPREVLPEVRDCAAEFGATAPELFGAAIPIRGIAGDQQAALIGQACFAPGMMKATYGTGVLCHSQHRQERGRVAQPADHDHRVSARRRDRVRSRRCDLRCRRGRAMAARRAAHRALRRRDRGDGRGRRSGPGGGSGAGLRRSRRALLGRRGARRAVRPDARHRTERTRARRAGKRVFPDASTSWRPCSPIAAPCADTVLRVDGGMAASDWTMQRLADILGAPVDRPTIRETTALGAAYLAGLQSGLYPEPATFAHTLGAGAALHRRDG